MDANSECSVLESVEDNESTANNLDCDLNFDADNSKVKANGSCSIENHHVNAASGHVDTHILKLRDGAESEQVGKSVNSPPLAAVKSPDGGSPPTVTKGYGLRKWRRIKRDVVKDVNLSVDSGKVLKRGLSVSANPSKLANEVKQQSEGSVGSTIAIINVGVTDGFLTRGLSMESRFAIGSAFAAGTDSENSEDRSSKSSTGASAPRMRYDVPAMPAHVREKSRMKNLSVKGVSSSAQRVQQGMGRVESSKKHRGEGVNIEKENSHSSIESDSRSSNFVFAQGCYSVLNNEKQIGSSMNYDGENSDENHVDEQEFSEEVQTGYGEDNIDEVKNLSRDDLAADVSWEDKEEKSENHPPSTDQDPLVESIRTLHFVQEALESEVKKLADIGKVITVPADSSFFDPGIHESSTSDQFDSENVRQSSFSESQVSTLTENVKYLESKLEEAKAMLKVKESKVAELEAILNTGPSVKVESENTRDLQCEKSEEIETDLESLFRQKIEAEVEYLALTRTIQKLRDAAGDQITLFEEQEALAAEQAQMLNQLGEAESKAAILKKEAEHLEEYCAEILVTKEVMKLQKRVCKVTSYFLTQLVLLILVFWLLVSQLSPPSGFVVPT